MVEVFGYGKSQKLQGSRKNTGGANLFSTAEVSSGRVYVEVYSL